MTPPDPLPLLDEQAVRAAADELICTDGEPYLGSDEAREGWARSVLAAYFAALDREEYVVRVQALRGRAAEGVIGLPGLKRISPVGGVAELVFATSPGCDPAGLDFICAEVERMGARVLAAEALGLFTPDTEEPT